MAAPNFEEAIVLAVNHSGDRASMGAIARKICGALYREAAIPGRWLERLKLRDEITRIADDVAWIREGTLDVESDLTFTRVSRWQL